MKKGDLKSAQIDLRNAVRTDPQNAEAHYWLARVSLELGDPVAAEREAIAARDRGFDPHQTVPLLAQALLAQNKFKDLLNTLKPDGKDPQLDAAILVSRGYAQIGLRQNDDAQHVLRRSRTGRTERGGAAAGRRPPARPSTRRPRRRPGEDRPRHRRAAEIRRGLAGQGAVAAPEGRHSRRDRWCWTS